MSATPPGTTPPEGTPQENAPQPTPQPTAPGPVPPTAPPATAPRPTAPDEPSTMALAVDHVVPGTRDLPSRKRWKVVATTLSLVAALGLVGIYANYAVPKWLDESAKPSDAATDQRIQDDLDKEETAFTAAVDYDRSPPETWRVVLDRPLTAPEQRRLGTLDGDAEAARGYLTSLGGRTLRHPSSFDDRADLMPRFTGTDATVFLMNLFSRRQSKLTVLSMEAVDVSCRTPTARTVVDLPPQGGAAYEGVLFDLSTPAAPPIVTDAGPLQGQPHFAHRKIDLGGGESPGGLRVEAVTRAKTCDWAIEAKYRDEYQGFGALVLKDGDKPFVAEGTPLKPEQLWVRDSSEPRGRQWLPCHERPAESACAAWYEGHAGTAGAAR
ncbi:hypothetical protein [Streptomyces sp. NPDC090025]|uniref:hypothetical protein n=1 Tax=Streptomyces sp. NPDC090025 TaxID=3365922 RepID=UPI0038385447